MWKPDAYTAAVLDRMEPEVRSTYSLEQMQALAKSLNPKKSPHIVDLRGTIPLWFTRLYFVLLIGKDRRRDTRNIARDRRRRTRRLALIGLLLAAFFAFAGVVFLVAYYLKTQMGIDINPDSHLSDVVSD